MNNWQKSMRPFFAPDAGPAGDPADDPAPSPAAAPNPEPQVAPQPSPAAAPAAKPTLAASDPQEGDPVAPADFPDNWREKLAGEDKKLLTQLQRYASPKAFSDAYFALRNKMSSGQLKSSLPQGATEEQIAEWRKDNNIPDKPEGYDLTLEGGLVVGENDKENVGEFLKEMHSINASPDMVKRALSAYYKIEAAQKDRMEDADATYRMDSEETMREQWGADFKKNINMVTGLLATLPEDARNRLIGGRTADGKLIGDDPEILQALANWSREINPAATLVPATGSKAASAIDDEIHSIQKLMGDSKSDYWKGPKMDGGIETKMQVRYRELVAAKEKMAARTAA